ncbi:MAG TPA: hypothetical protein VN493_30465 [Thermoanaerobaculia bacterium]|nr:hypothetical protein [Thermoanaerobaculia bacterium]
MHTVCRQSGTSVYPIWRTDGRPAGLVQDIAPGASWSTPEELTATGQSLYFSAHDSVHGRELWELPEP